MIKQFITKNTTLEVKDVDASKGIVTLYASAFGNVDSQGDIIARGAYAKSISERMPRIKHLFMHKTSDIIGRPLSMVEDGQGLLVESYITEANNGDHRLKYKEGLYTEHSVGIIPIQQTNNQDGTRTLTEVKLYEYSTVTWGANANTPVVGMKSAEQLNERLQRLEKFLRNSSATDETLIAIEIEIKQIQALIKGEPDNHSQTNEPQIQIPNFLTLYNSF
jgi:HK97 family phage prohead protease